MPGLDGQTRASKNVDAELRTRTDPPVNTAVQAEDDRLAVAQHLLRMQPWHVEQYGQHHHSEQTMIHVLIVVLLYLGTPAPECMFLDRAGFTVPAYPQHIVADNYHILSAPRTAQALICTGFKPVTFRPGVTMYSMHALKTGKGIVPPVSPTPIGE